MSEAHTLAPSPAIDAMARIMVRAVFAGKSSAKLLKAVRRLRDLADEMEDAAQACANVYPIRGDGQPLGGRPADIERLAVAHALRAALRAEIPAAAQRVARHPSNP